MMPPGGAGARADQFEALERIQHDRLTDPGLAKLLDALEPWAASADPDSDDASLIRVLRRDHQKAVQVPTELAAEISSAAAHAQQSWLEAREKGDFDHFAPSLERVLELQSRYIACFDGTGEFAHPYDILLDDYEPGLTTRGAPGHLRASCRRSSCRSSPPPRRRARTATCSRGTSRVRRSSGWPTSCCTRSASRPSTGAWIPPSIPFARSMAATDVRLTTRWEEDDLAMAFYSCLHEFGHGLYEAQFEPRHYRTTLAEATGLGVHESQSRLWENLVGRSRPFCEWVLPLLRRHLGGPFEAQDAAALYRAVNQVRLSLIRIEADETTYNLHIALRFELELAMVEGRLAVADLPDAWDEATHRLLGLETPSVMEGVLQDIHWGAGMIGYFPTYTIGNLMAAQLWRALSDDLPDIDGQIAAGDFAPAARVAAREHPPPRAQVRLARAAPAGDRGGAQRRAVAGLPRGQAAGCRVADRPGAGSPLVAGTRTSVRRSRPAPAIEWWAVLCRARQNSIVVTGAREHNLKDVTVSLPRDSLVVITGLSGSGKSSLAFDTIYAEGQRRYVESLSAYARQFLGQMDKPDVDSIEGLSPAISIDQKTTSRNPRSTVGTVTEIYDYLRLLWARIGKPHCFNCGRPIAAQSAEQIIDQIMGMDEGTRFMVMAPIVRGRKGEYGKQLQELRSEGFTRVKVDGELRTLEEDIVLDKKYKHDISVVVDRLVMRTDLRKRLADSVETAVALADGIIEVETVPREGAGEVFTYSERFACLHCGISMPELEPRSFSFNAPHGACPRCTGLGSMMEIDPELVVPDPSLTINEGAILPWSSGATSYYEQIAQAIAERYQVDVDSPWEDLPEEVQNLFLYGTNGDKLYVSLPQPDGAQAVVHDDLRGHRPQPRAPLQGDGLRLVAGEDRGVHVDAAVPGVQGRAAAAGVAGGQGRRDSDPRVHGAERQAGDRVDGRAGALEPGPGDRAADPARDRRAAAVPGQRGRRLPVDGAGFVDAVGWRGAADPAGDPDRLVAGRRALHPR